jgi:hypothetical protein
VISSLTTIAKVMRPGSRRGRDSSYNLWLSKTSTIRIKVADYTICDFDDCR